MKVLLVGAGGREHALGWKLAQSPLLDELWTLPGNPGLAELGPVVEGIDPEDAGAVAAFAAAERPDLVVVGPEGPLAAGLVDVLARIGIAAFGPTRAAARLESSKSYAKEVMGRAGVPTAPWEAFTEAAPARAHLAGSAGPYVVKADGLAAGKGVLVTESRQEAESWVDRCLGGEFGRAGGRVVIEEYLAGPEVSLFFLCQGTEAAPLAPARDYKRLADGDRGPNTGGMGAYSPVELPAGLEEVVLDRVVRPVLGRMVEEGHPYSGFLYAGLVLTSAGPRVLEFNCRLGDPETQAILPRLETDLLPLLAGGGGGGDLVWSNESTVAVVLAAAGYPEAPRTGDQISGLRDCGALVFQAGTRRDGRRLFTGGGRVVSVVGRGPTLEEARWRAYAAVEGIKFGGRQFRTDVAVEKEAR